MVASSRDTVETVGCGHLFEIPPVGTPLTLMLPGGDGDQPHRKTGAGGSHPKPSSQCSTALRSRNGTHGLDVRNTRPEPVLNHADRDGSGAADAEGFAF